MKNLEEVDIKLAIEEKMNEEFEVYVLNSMSTIVSVEDDKIC